MPRHNRPTCAKGHPLSGENLYLKPCRRGVMRICRTCQRGWDEKHRRTRFDSHGLTGGKATRLDPKALARLKEAYRDGVILDDLAARFRLSKVAVCQLVTT